MPTPELQAALEAAGAAARVIRPLFQKNLAVRTKADASPVTEVDLRAEEVIRDHLTRAFPGYGFYGEETGQHAMQAESLWLVDPIDGTKAFVRESPFFSTQIALMRAGELVLGVSSAPLYGELAWAERGSGAFLNDRAVRVSRVARLEDAFISTGNLRSLARSSGWQRLVHYHLLARGGVDVVIESDVNILDIAALVVLTREAGGTFTDLAGAPVGLETRSVLAANAAIHENVLDALRR
jgi:histidinol-phosphatase